MFQFNTKVSPADPNPTNVNPNTALPNSHGKVRTLKEDYEDFKNGKLKKEQELSLENVPGVNPLPATPAPAPPPAPAPIMPISRPVVEPPKPMERSTFLPPRENEKKEEKKETPSPFGSQSFFNGKSPFEEARQPVLPQKKDGAAPKGNSRKTFTIVFSSLLALAILGGGFYYYWFFIKKSPLQNTVQPPAQTNPVPPSDTQSINKNLRSLNIDASLGKDVNQKAFQDLAESFQANAAENDLVEVKVLDKNNQPVAPKELAASLGFSLSDKLLLNLTNDYSLFIKKENSEVRTGAAFKLSDATGLLDELGQQEKTLSSQLLPFYLKGAPTAATISFNSSKYKNADIRYFNFPEPSNTSLDYSILTDKQNGYFIFATSKNTIHSILDFMWGK